MAVPDPGWAQDLLDFWFDELNDSDWFKPGPAVDLAIKERFEPTLTAFAEAEPGEFLTDSDTTRAAILLFDQLPRNLYRESARAFAYDDKALFLAKEAIARGWDRQLPDRERQFVAMPLMHSEDLADQDASVAYFGKHLPDNLSFAHSHRQMIARFGRFPHRNAALGRETTDAEQAAIDEGFSW